MNRGFPLALISLLAGIVLPARGAVAQQAMPVREITVFKDGHAFVLHAGRMPTDAAGNVRLDSLPTPVLGTFWPYAADARAKLVSVTASQQKATEERTALSVRELLEANPGAQIMVTQRDGQRYSAQVVGVPKRALEPPPSAVASGARTRFGAVATPVESYAPQADTVLLKTKEGVQALPFDQIKTVTFKGAYRRAVPNETFRNRLTLKLDWQGRKAEKTASVGMVYLQRGVRWIPNYKVTIDGKGNAVVRLQATLINEMVDLNDVTVYLVIGVPTFAFKDAPDPISLQQSFPELSRYFQPDSQTGFAFSNAIMSQSGGFGGGGFGGMPGGRTSLPDSRGSACYLPQRAGGDGMAPGDIASDTNEDLFVFTVRHVTLQKGQNMVLPVAETTRPYRDVYTLEVRPRPSAETERNLNPEQAEELKRLLRVPRALHKIRLTNRSAAPLTTAPALIIHESHVVAQAMMTYTAVGAEADITLTTAGDIKVRKSEQETGRTLRALSWHSYDYDKIAMAGTLAITNFGNRPIDLEVSRLTQGHVDQVGQDGIAEMLNPEDEIFDFANNERYYLATGVNGVGRFAWKLKLAPGESASLTYSWHYFTR